MAFRVDVRRYETTGIFDAFINKHVKLSTICMLSLAVKTEC
jgi:hypothetical protein